MSAPTRSWLRALAWVGLAGGVGAALALGLPGTVRHLIVDPLVRLGWLITALPQAAVWAGLVILGAVAAGRALATLSPAERTPPSPPPPPPPSQLEQVVRLVQRAQYSPLARRRLARRLAQAAVTLRVRREPVSHQRAWADLRSGAWPTDPDLRAVLVPARLRSRPAQSGDFLAKLSRAVDALTELARGADG
ncbi:MAG: DUF7269 family protein [Candidatus Bipolaricaulaceae bacterium]